MDNNSSGKNTEASGKWIAILIPALILIPLAVAFLVQYFYLHEVDRIADERLTLYENTLALQLNKYEYLPSLLAGIAPVKSCLASGRNTASVNAYLEKVAAQSGATAIFLVGENGRVVSSSNWNLENSYVGLDLSFRPYFKGGMKGREVRFYGVGLASEKPGYYIASPVEVEGLPRGVAVVKIDLSTLQNIWRDGGETLFVADSYGIIILSSRPSWQYRTLDALSPEAVRNIHEGGQYPEPRLSRLDMESESFGFMKTVRINGDLFLRTSRQISGLDWELNFLMGLRPVWERMLGTALTSFVLVGLGILTLLFIHERNQKEVSRREAREAERIRSMNIQLEQEIAERRRTEEELRAAQEELIEAGKLAAVGEMATAVAHELNQPIAALKMYAASSRLMLEKGLTEDLAPTLASILGLSDRMAGVTSQLKSFARKSSDPTLEFDIRDSIEASLSLMHHQLEHEDCKVEISMPAERVPFSAESGRFEQVLINLLRNALDAMQGQKEKRLEISLRVDSGKAVLRVADTGPGLDSSIAGKVFEPFVTTKREGVGLGLGLSISYKIIREMGGGFKAFNSDEAGAVFVISLPLRSSQENLDG